MQREYQTFTGVACHRIERIVEAPANPLFHGTSAVNWQVVAQVLREDPQIVEAEQMIGVPMGIGYGMDSPNPFPQQLNA